MPGWQGGLIDMLSLCQHLMGLQDDDLQGTGNVAGRKGNAHVAGKKECDESSLLESRANESGC